MIFTLFMAPVMGRLSQKTGRRKLFTMCVIAVGVSMIFIYHGTAASAYFGFFLMGIFGMGSAGLMFAAVGDMVEPGNDANGMGVCVTLDKLGQFLATTIFLPVLSLTGGSYFITACVFAIGGIVLSLITLRIAKNFN